MRSPRSSCSRRTFLTRTGALAVTFTVLPRHVLGAAGARARFTNCAEADALLSSAYREGWKL